MDYTALIHSHVSSWALAILLFLVAFYLLSKGKEKGGKIVHHILRLFYVLTLITGFYLLYLINFLQEAVIKGVLAFILIVIMEMILVRTKKGTLRKNTSLSLWTGFIALLGIVLYIGYEVLK